MKACPAKTPGGLPSTMQARRIMNRFEQQKRKMRTQDGFIAALDQSGGSTPKALNQYGVKNDAWSNEDEMYKVVHQMRTRIVTTPAFNGDRILAAILFENTMDREIEGRPTSDYLWNVKRVVPFLKVDKGLADEQDGAQLMKPMPALAALLDKAKGKGIFGTKMRSVVKQANRAGIDAVLDQQFEVGRQIVAAGLVPIIEPEVDIKCPDKPGAEKLLKAGIIARLGKLRPDEMVMLKLTPPDEDNLYADCIEHRNCLRVVALSGGYSRDEANRRLARQRRMIASFSRALVEGLTAQMSDDQFDEAMDASIHSIFEASRT
jgi:fructose-bisphosphate aldolase class I